MPETKIRDAFTLVELLIAVSILLIMTGILLPGFANYTKSQGVVQAVDKLKNDLRTIQNKAMTGSGSLDGANFWGAKISDNSTKYFYFSSASSTAVDCANISAGTNVENFSGDALIRNGDICLFFAMYNGDVTFYKFSGGSWNIQNCDTSGACLISVGLSTYSGTQCSGVELNTAGLIKGVSDKSCE